VIKDEFFVFSASHVFDDIGGYQLLLGIGGGSKLAALSGERFSSKKGSSGNHSDDPIDASVFHIQSDIADKIKSIAISLSDLDLDQPDESRSVHMAAGFRVKKSNTAGNQAKAKRECFPLIEYGSNEYSSLGIDRKTHIALAYENQVLMDENWQTSPTPKGLSGGAIVKVQGVEMSPPFSTKSNAKQLLAAITIEQRRENAVSDQSTPSSAYAPLAIAVGERFHGSKASITSMLSAAGNFLKTYCRYAKGSSPLAFAVSISP